MYFYEEREMIDKKHSGWPNMHSLDFWIKISNWESIKLVPESAHNTKKHHCADSGTGYLLSVTSLDPEI